MDEGYVFAYVESSFPQKRPIKKGSFAPASTGSWRFALPQENQTCVYVNINILVYTYVYIDVYVYIYIYICKCV